MSSFSGTTTLISTAAQTNLIGASTSAVALTLAVSGDANKRFQVTSDGTHAWGPGTTAADVYFYRSGLNTLTFGKTNSDALATIAAASANLSGTLTTPNIQGTAGGQLIFLANGCGFSFNRSGALTVLDSYNGGANHSWLLNSDGSQGYGPGSTAPDTFVYRSAVNVMAIGSSTSAKDGALLLNKITNTSSAASAPFLQAQFSADTAGDYRFSLTNDGIVGWGSGTATQDIFLFRKAANQLSIGTTSTGSNGAVYLGSINALSGASTAAVWANVAVTGDTNSRFVSQSDGTMFFGPGNTTSDTVLYRSGVNIMAIGSTTTAKDGTLNAATFHSYNNSAGITTYQNTSSTNGSDPTFTLDSDGQLGWANFGTASFRDIWMYRSSSHTLTLSTDTRGSAKGLLNLATITSNALTVSTAFLQSQFSTDTAGDYRFALTNDGIASWGTGLAAQDTFLYRSGVKTLSLGSTSSATDGTLQVTRIANTGGANIVLVPSGGNVDFSGANIINANLGIQPNFPISGTVSTSTSPVLEVEVTGDSQFRYYIEGSGQTSWGPGGVTARDTFLYRSSASTLTLSSTSGGTNNCALNTGALSVNGTIGVNNATTVTLAAATSSALLGLQSGDTVARLNITAAGAHEWGPGGATARDTFLSRTAAGTLSLGTTSGGSDGILNLGTLNAIKTVASQSTANSTTAEFYNTGTGLGGMAPNLKLYQNKVATTNATTTTLFTVATASNVVYTLRACINARWTGGTAGAAGDCASYEITGAYINNAGTLTLIEGTAPTVNSFKSTNAYSWAATFTISTTNILVQVTGLLNNNISWSLNLWVSALDS